MPEQHLDDAIRPLLLAYCRAELSGKAVLFNELRALLGHFVPLPDGAWRAIRASTVRTAPLVARQIKTTLSLPCSPEDGIEPATFRECATAAEIKSLTALLRWQRTGEVARQAALALHQIALATPVPQLRQALPALQPAWHTRFAHPELTQARKAIEAVTTYWQDLPLPAESDEYEGRDLPLPAEVGYRD
jgi:hypothetical protein